MNRSLIAPIAATATSLAVQITIAIWPEVLRRYSWAVKYLWVIALLLWLCWCILRFVRNHQDPSKFPASGLTSNSQRFGPINVNISPTISSTVASPTTISRSHSEPVVHHVRTGTEHRPKVPKIVFRKPRSVWLTMKRENCWAITDEHTGVRGSVLPVYNDPTLSSSDAEFVRAAVSFLEQGNPVAEKCVIGDACWIDEPHESTSLRLGDEKLIVLVVANGEGQYAMANTARGLRGLQMAYNVEDPVKPIDLSGTRYQVDICLIHGGNSQFKDFHGFHLDIAGLYPGGF